MGPIAIGIDIGQKRDPTAVCVAELEYRDRADHWLARHLERLPLGTPYPQVAERVQTVIANIRRQAPAVGIHLYVDATGVGQPVVDLLKGKGHRARPCRLLHPRGSPHRAAGRDHLPGQGLARVTLAGTPSDGAHSAAPHDGSTGPRPGAPKRLGGVRS
jgi:hypothetical protein